MIFWLPWSRTNHAGRFVTVYVTGWPSGSTNGFTIKNVIVSFQTFHGVDGIGYDAVFHLYELGACGAALLATHTQLLFGAYHVGHIDTHNQLWLYNHSLHHVAHGIWLTHQHSVVIFIQLLHWSGIVHGGHCSTQIPLWLYNHSWHQLHRSSVWGHWVCHNAQQLVRSAQRTQWIVPSALFSNQQYCQSSMHKSPKHCSASTQQGLRVDTSIILSQQFILLIVQNN